MYNFVDKEQTMNMQETKIITRKTQTNKKIFACDNAEIVFNAFAKTGKLGLYMLFSDIQYPERNLEKQKFEDSMFKIKFREKERIN